MATARLKIKTKDSDHVLLRCGRRCGFCFGLNRDSEIKQGQIAHLDQNNKNPAFDNLMFMCLAHHDQYDSKTSQSKNLTIGEAKEYRDRVGAFIAGEAPDVTINKVRAFITQHAQVLIYISDQGEQIAVEHDLNLTDFLCWAMNDARTQSTSCFNIGVRTVLTSLAENLNLLYGVIGPIEYIETSTRRKFDNTAFEGVDVQALLREKKKVAGEASAAIAADFLKLEQYVCNIAHIEESGTAVIIGAPVAEQEVNETTEADSQSPDENK